MDIWLPLREIIFTRDQVLWLLPYLSMLQEGQYPLNPQGTGYVDAPMKKLRVKASAYFTRPVEIAAEIDIRLEKTGIEGKLLVAEARVDMRINELSPEARTALNYISGWRRRKLSYSAWKKQRKYHRKVASK